MLPTLVLALASAALLVERAAALSFRAPGSWLQVLMVSMAASSYYIILLHNYYVQYSAIKHIMVVK